MANAAAPGADLKLVKWESTGDCAYNNHKDRKDLTRGFSAPATQIEVEVVRHQFRRNDITVIQGSAQFLDPHTIRVTTESGDISLMAEKILIASGTRPARDPMIPFDGQTVIDVGELEHLTCIPKELIVVGAGVIGIEYASMCAALGVRVSATRSSEMTLAVRDRGRRPRGL